MDRQEKIIACFLLFQALAGAATLAWVATTADLTLGTWITASLLIAAALVAGLASLLRKRWGERLGLVVFAAQTPIFATPTFSYSLWIGAHLDITGTWEDQAKLGVNLVGAIMFAWASFRYHGMHDRRAT